MGDSLPVDPLKAIAVLPPLRLPPNSRKVIFYLQEPPPSNSYSGCTFSSPVAAVDTVLNIFLLLRYCLASSSRAQPRDALLTSVSRHSFFLFRRIILPSCFLERFHRGQRMTFPYLARQTASFTTLHFTAIHFVRLLRSMLRPLCLLMLCTTPLALIPQVLSSEDASGMHEFDDDFGVVHVYNPSGTATSASPHSKRNCTSDTAIIDKLLNGTGYNKFRIPGKVLLVMMEQVN